MCDILIWFVRHPSHMQCLSSSDTILLFSYLVHPSLSVLQSIWNLQIQCSHSYGGSLGFIGYHQVPKLWSAMLLSFIGLCKHNLPSLWFEQMAMDILTIYDLNICNLVLQALYGFSGIWCVICHFLCCSRMYDWYCCLLLSAMPYCNFICSCRSGNLCVP